MEEGERIWDLAWGKGKGDSLKETKKYYTIILGRKPDVRVPTGGPKALQSIGEIGTLQFHQGPIRKTDSELQERESKIGRKKRVHD